VQSSGARGRRGVFHPGQVVPGTRYRVVALLGAGGHGGVYEVEHTFLRAPAVMKVLHAELAARADLTTRMMREARTLARLRHPNLVEVRDGGMTDELPPRPYFVMEPLVGMSLRAVLKSVRGRVGIVPALRLATSVLEGLEHAHRAGVVHRDVKPDNIFLHRTSTDLTVPKVVDFGVAHVILGRRVTGRSFVGTPRYAAPEQVRGERPTPRTDIYAVGLMLRELISGEAPFAGHDEVGALAAARLSQDLAPLAPSVPGVTRALDGLLASMTARCPRDRPPTAFSAAVGLREVRARMDARSGTRSSCPTVPTPLHNMMVGITPRDEAIEERPSVRTQPEEPTPDLNTSSLLPAEARASHASPSSCASDASPPSHPPRPSRKKQIAIAIALAVAVLALPALAAHARVWPLKHARE
jgi:eukaryotic-like serine/threonine-protein kinase